jgi:hypothetical protein
MDVPQKLESPAGFLASVEILSPFTAEEIEQLAERAEPRFYAFGETICNAGDAADGLFVVKAGSVRIFTEENGKEISMGVRREREVFADIAMLREYRHESSVRSSGKTELLYIPRQAIEPIVANNPAALAFVTSYVAISSSRNCSICGARSTRPNSRRPCAAWVSSESARARRSCARIRVTTGGSMWCGRAKCVSCARRARPSTSSPRSSRAKSSVRRPA